MVVQALGLAIACVWTAACRAACGLAVAENAEAAFLEPPLPSTTQQSLEFCALLEPFSPWLNSGWLYLGLLMVAAWVPASQLNCKRSSPLRLATLFVLCIAQGATAQGATAEVRLGGLFQHTTIKLGRFAAFVMAVQEINNSTELLPYTALKFAVKDSACDKGSALVGAHELVQNSFSGLGADAVIGAACSGASMAAADYLTFYQIPQLSPSSTSSALSDRVTYPYFARTPPSDALQSFALADLVEHLLKVERVATVNSEDSYGASGIQEFKDHANRRKLQVLASTSFVNGQADFSSNVDVLRRSGALVIVLFCQTADASRFIQATQAAISANITWVGSEAVTAAVRSMVSSSPDQASRLRGLSPRSN